MRAAFAGQDPFDLRFAHGPAELEAVADGVAAIVVVDVLRFSTCVSVAVARGGQVLPYRWRDEGAAAFAEAQGAELAGDREDGGWSLSPTDLQGLPRGARVVLPSPNGADLSLRAARACETVIAGCLRNAYAVGTALARLASAGPIAVVAAGEQGSWAVEDLLGAGAILHAAETAGSFGRFDASPEARAAIGAFRAADDLEWSLRSSTSGRELIARGWGDDVAVAAALNVDDVVPALADGAYSAPNAPL